MSAPPRTVGAHLAWLVVLSTALGLAAFTLVAAAAVWIDERGEADELDEPDELGETPFDEVVEDLGPGFAVATPFGLLVAILGARWASRRFAGRVDGLIAAASRMTADDLAERLPVSSRQDELDRLAVALNSLFARIDEGVAGLRRFAADASHELRTPLTVMISTLEVASRRPRDVAEWERVAARTLDELRRTAGIVEALLQSARAGAFDLATEPVEIDDAIADVLAQWQAPAGDAEVALVAAPGGAGAVRIDPRGLGIALGNLVSNAIAHSPPGAPVTVTTARRGAEVEITVDDRGPGVAAGERDRIFEPFVRGARGDGVGLGLAIARRLIEAHRGRISVGEAPGGGARFVVTLPACQV